MQSPALRYENARNAFSQLNGHWLATEPLERWSLPSDRHLPSALIILPLSEVLNKPYAVLLETRGVGESKLEKLIVLIERALAELSRNTEFAHLNDQSGSPSGNLTALDCSWDSPIANVDEINPRNLSESTWKRICQCISDHSLQHYPLGRFAETLYELPRGLWSCPISDFVTHEFRELRNLKGYGEQRITSVLKVLAATANLVADCPADTHLGIRVFPCRIERITSWINRVLRENRLPDYSSLCQHFVLPLLQQLECDLGSQTAEVIERRLGIEGEPETLEQIAESFDLTRERIRQFTLRAPEVMDVRWQEGKHLLDDFFEKFHLSGEAIRHVKLIQRTLVLLFDVEAYSGISRDEVMQAWEGAGKQKKTPMSEIDILGWLGGSFPELKPSLGLKWITSESLSVEYEDQQLYFSTEESDCLLHRLYILRRASAIQDLVDLCDREQRNLRMKLQRDLRFSEDEDHCFLPTEFYGFARDAGDWHIKVDAVHPGGCLSRALVAVDGVIAATLSGFIRAGIFDVTVWGFHRFVNEQLGHLYDARLPKSITPFVLGDMVIRQSGKRIRPMRRRRLRWDSGSDASLLAKGKQGWVAFVVQQLGIPIVIDELGELLKKYYQDYDSYVIEQLSLDTEEEGDIGFGASIHAGIPHKLPPVVVPDGWELDAVNDNVSEGVKLSMARAITLLQDKRIALTDLEHVPWFTELILRNSYGNEFKHQQISRRGDIRSEVEDTCVDPELEEGSEDDLSSLNAGHSSRSSSENVDDLLKRFL